MKRPRTSLRRRLTALCSLLTIVAIAVIGLDSYRRERAMLEHSTRRSLETLAQMVAVNVRSSVAEQSPAAVTEFLTTVADTMDLQLAAVVSADGAWFSISGDSDLLPELLPGTRQVGPDWVSSVNLDYVDKSKVRRRAVVIVRTSGQPMRLRLQEYLEGLLATMVLALLLLAFAAHWLLTRLLAPVQGLLDTTVRVRQTEDYSLRAAGSADDEIGALVRAFNAMLEAIQGRDNNLARLAEHLEQQVRERTAELRHAVEVAETATRVKSTFLANMSHEIRTPLNAILGMSDLAMESEDPRELREYLGVIRNAGSNLLGVLCDVLDLSKIESDKLELSPVPTDLEALALEALRPLTSRIQDKDLELTLEVDPALADAYRLDDVRVRQILTNLVSNAIKFTANGVVRVTLAVEERRGDVHDVALVVEDTGTGIPKDRLTAIFTPFTQADSTITRRFAGTGLGLSITDRLVRLMGGTITVDSTVGKGSTFRIRLPLTTCASPLPPLPQLASTTRLFAIGRSAPTLRALESTARRLGVSLVTLDGGTALRSFGAIGPGDVVLVDERDAERDAELCEWLPSGPRGVRPVLLITSFQDLANASARCRRCDFAGYLTKPVSARELAGRIATLQSSSSESAASPGASTTENPAENPVASVRPAAAAPATSLRILVAEDNPVNQRLIERILQRDGHQVTLAENGKVCCETFAREPFDIVLMDMQMPEMSGLEAAAQIRTTAATDTPRVPIVALTANTTIEDRTACLEAGMDEVLSKPVSVPKLRAVLADVAARRAPPAP
ncbi:MAG: response regulator [Planctomycetes bacterium]|nr:response regulator [Planctomycetota bacterium]